MRLYDVVLYISSMRIKNVKICDSCMLFIKHIIEYIIQHIIIRYINIYKRRLISTS